MKTTVPLYKTVAIAIIAVILSALLTASWLDAGGTPEESHLVFDYIHSNGLPASWEATYHAINKDWPPSRNRLAGLLLDAQIATARRVSQ